jgi:NAD(P)H-dependent FMN reductase
VRSQLHLRQVLMGTGMHGMPGPELMVSMAQEKIDAEGNLTDEETRSRLRAVVAALVAFARRNPAKPR